MAHIDTSDWLVCGRCTSLACSRWYPNQGAVVDETDRVLAPGGRVSIYDKFSPEDGEPALARRVANPIARLLFADLNRPLEPMVAGTSLTVGRREPFLGGLYTVAVAHSTTDS